MFCSAVPNFSYRKKLRCSNDFQILQKLYAVRHSLFIQPALEPVFCDPAFSHPFLNILPLLFQQTVSQKKIGLLKIFTFIFCRWTALIFFIGFLHHTFYKFIEFFFYVHFDTPFLSFMGFRTNCLKEGSTYGKIFMYLCFGSRCVGEEQNTL